MLANVFEAHGLSTVALVSILGQAQRMKAPRALYCEFPLGRPLGAPDDVPLQRDVIMAAFDLLSTPQEDVPVLRTFPRVISDSGAAPLACALPPRLDLRLHPAVDEARGLLASYYRARERFDGRTSVGKAIVAEQVPAALEAFAAVAAGRTWEEAGLDAPALETSSDIRSFYEEAAVGLSSHVPLARQAQTWFLQHTEAGALLAAARDAMRAGGAPESLWANLLPRG